MQRSYTIFRTTRGFTLIEVLLSLGLFSIVVVTVYGTFSAGLQLNRRSNDQNDIYREARWSLELLKKDLENMVDYDFSGSYKEDRKAFDGKKDRISLILPTEEGLRVIKYYLMSRDNDRIHREIVRQATARNVTVFTGEDDAEEAFFLVREEIDFVDFLADDSKTGEIEVIATAVKRDGLKFYYYDHASVFDPQWEPQWEKTTSPMIVYAQLEFLSDDSDSGSLKMGGKVILPANNYKLIRDQNVIIN